ncbi:MAG: hypothetical protein A3C30_03720 [Candidatus Levybacteria bacterium RIFCSPHIGHO2_02_FULL_40_18]|nr:MAG: hypothetical protein A2869_00295 [Candidatus Levybacteria bacterium RIFCSPHIGHO2_01_FULL_40_58]OGH26194.1 MAG: hypothetical protein A3C30_03720 [Candidatus Levybacteria bacterium RIFCSPHIGHO2_02_FULL_40_18]OGH31352.1 MAG: hypothetical protein A3E43_03200 [Candidatus Levybacteria bacterium RIFCSPHIGHO2_12_FULL_40_31]OGH40077.1 MAG: hypothetical protein A2894_04035 [Candidatus Levybacteria bacterium RIFCSPLOWO2_01_FULL_40_64]OGH49040.1 MAG: hypothetical protein A3I54_00500 [Candidatus Lev
MNKKLFIDLLGWGFLLWLIGYGLGIMLFTLVPPSQIGWFVTPIGVAITLFVLIKKIKSTSPKYYLLIGITWTLVAIIGDYLFIVKAFNPENGYYKFDIYLYYSLTFILPLAVGLLKSRRINEDK